MTPMASWPVGPGLQVEVLEEPSRGFKAGGFVIVPTAEEDLRREPEEPDKITTTSAEPFPATQTITDTAWSGRGYTLEGDRSGEVSSRVLVVEIDGGMRDRVGESVGLRHWSPRCG